MQEELAAIDRVVREHEQTLSTIRDCDVAVRDLAGLKQEWIPGRPMALESELAQLEKVLKRLAKELRSHIRFEEQEFLPTLIKYASGIVSRGLLFEHKEILTSITDLVKNLGDLSGKPANRDELTMKQSRIKESIDRILILVEHHAYTQEVIFNLAREAVAHESEQDRQSP